MTTRLDVVTADADRRRRRRRWPRLTGVASMVGAIVVLVVVLAPWAGSGDPGGRILAQPKPVTYSLPVGTHLRYRQLDEPARDSCDGRPGTQGWSDVAAGVSFVWHGPADQLVGSVSRHMRALGWRFAPAIENGQAGGRWTKMLTEGTSATAILGIEPGGSTWNLWAVAPPAGHRASGC